MCPSTTAAANESPQPTVSFTATFMHPATDHVMALPCSMHQLPCAKGSMYLSQSTSSSPDTPPGQ
jgi:hypothetical protein